MEESFSQLAGEERLGKISEELLDHVGHIVGGLVLIIHILRRVLVHLPESLDARFHSRLAEESHLEIIWDTELMVKKVIYGVCVVVWKPLCPHSGILGSKLTWAQSILFEIRFCQNVRSAPAPHEIFKRDFLPLHVWGWADFKILGRDFWVRFIQMRNIFQCRKTVQISELDIVQNVEISLCERFSQATAYILTCNRWTH